MWNFVEYYIIVGYNYLGTVDVIEQFEITPQKGALLFIEMYGGIDGDHHKDWVLDQVARILNGAPIAVKQASWSNGHTELRYTVGTSDQYVNWTETVQLDNDGNRVYSYNEGIAP